MYTLDISSLKLSTRIGVHEWEQRIHQRLLIDISMTVDCDDCQDTLKNTIDYDHVCRRVTSHIESNSFLLIETVAEQVATLINDEFKVSKLTVRVSKPDAIKNAGNIAVTVHR